MVKAVIFDMDGVVTNSMPVYCKALNEVLKEHKVNIPLKRFNKEFPGTNPHYCIKKINKWYNLKLKEQETINTWHRHYRKLIPTVKLIKGYKSFLNKLRKANIKIAIATGSNVKNVKLALKTLKVQDHFPILDCAHLKHPKPAPDIYILAAKKLKINPEDCIVFDDALTGIKAAKKAKMKIVALSTTFPKTKLKTLKPDLIIKDYQNLTLTKLRAL